MRPLQKKPHEENALELITKLLAGSMTGAATPARRPTNKKKEKKCKEKKIIPFLKKNILSEKKKQPAKMRDQFVFAAAQLAEDDTEDDPILKNQVDATRLETI